MLFLLVVVLGALVLPLITRGSYRRLAETSWRAVPLLVLGIGAQIAIDLVHLEPDRAQHLGYGVVVASYVLVLGFACANLLVRGMAIVTIGIACNAVVLFVNQGMPVDVPPAWAERVTVETTAKHHPMTDDDQLQVLADIIPVPGLDTIVSYGDLILAAGLLDVVFHASRKVRRRKVAIDLPEMERSDQPVVDLTVDDDILVSSARRRQPPDDDGKRFEYL